MGESDGGRRWRMLPIPLLLEELSVAEGFDGEETLAAKG